MADTTETQTGGFWSGVDSFIGSVFSSTSKANEVYNSWQNFGKTDAEIKAESDAELQRLKAEAEQKRKEYQEQINATITARNQTASSNQNLILVGAGLLAFVLLTRGK